MQFYLAGNELRQNCLDAALDGRLIRTVTRDKLFDYRLKCRGRKKCVRNTHGDCRTKLQRRKTREQLDVGNEF